MSDSSPSPQPAAVVIGTSAGAIDALGVILPALPASFPLPILIVVHVPANHQSLLAELFGKRCALPVKEAEDKESLRPGTIYFAPSDYHLLVEPDFTLSLSSDEPVLYSRPAIDVLFQSAADAYGDGLTGIILTGANSDGADGLRAVQAAGGTALVQDPVTAQGAAMPRAALAACPSARSASLDTITTILKSIL